VNNFVRGAIWLLHQQGKTNRDIEVALHVNHTTVGDVIQQCENGDFLQEESPQPKALPQVVDQDVYFEQLKQTLGKAHWNDKYIWQQDGAAAHSSRLVLDWLTAHGYKTLQLKADQPIWQWPPNSPDLSPIENLWGHMWSRVAKKHPDTEDEQWAACQEVWNALDPVYVSNLLTSFRRRVQLCVEMQGHCINPVY
jgi:hypothetical protein